MNDLALLILAKSAGLFFVVTGARKVFLPEVRNKVIPFIMKQSHVPKPLAYAVILGELFGGLGLLSGILWQWAALGLIPIMAGAYFSDTLPGVLAKDKGEHWSKVVSNALCTPEAQLLIIVVALAVSGF